MHTARTFAPSATTLAELIRVFAIAVDAFALAVDAFVAAFGGETNTEPITPSDVVAAGSVVCEGDSTGHLKH